MRAALTATLSLAVLVLGACSTTPESQSPAGVEDRKPGATAPGGAKPGADVRTVQPPKVAPVDVARADPRSALKDPGSALSKRVVYFDYDKFDIKEEFRPVIEAHARYLRENPNAKMLVQGNADERGSREYNIALGQRRSESVKRMLVLLGAREAQIESVSLGEEKPACAEHNEDCWARNRRGEILYGGEY